MSDKPKLENINLDFLQTSIDKLYEEIKKTMDGSISRINIVSILLHMMQLIEGYEGLRGIDKKNVVIRVLNKLVDDTVELQQEKDELKLLISVTVPNIIDVFININLGNIAIKVKTKCFNWFKCSK